MIALRFLTVSKYGNKYIWPLYNSYDIFMADLDGKIVKQLTNSRGL